ncbi:hypothetical protein EHQ23_03480 [Leptospira bourretii]|uniref:Lipoprotein n=2 Tax=Leptospira TaxID=171 RepID=A0A4R9INC8_9LEPT|nr:MULTISPECIES: hypothetical protein [Leptospira]MCG6140447.1 hypothetical protein [Leptospira mtsangambouensis]TGK89460.1 hypothetical protein EHQ23_03480 [Leptospira bourretii]TGK93371.1 hypothetical protein EHQ26_04865 [Leptospira bourretii]TGL18304.1 hypothetical protein EHQ47_17365 [Leptospira bourretii]TGL30663.1 hypothetical protein EHQ45_13205 [Leptospira bourretii]
MKQIITITGIFFLSFIINNCASSSVGLATSNKPIPNTPYETVKTVEKTFTWYALDFIIFGLPFTEPPVTDLYEKVMEEDSGDALVNIRYWNDKSIFGPLTRYRFTIKGDLVRFPSQTSTKNKK